MKRDPINLSSATIFDDAFVSNKSSAREIAKKLKDGAPPMGFTGKAHPLTLDAEHRTDVALAVDDSDSHTKAADAHDKAGEKIASFMDETGPLVSRNHQGEMRGLKGTLTHHKARAAAHRQMAGLLSAKEKDQAAKDKAKDAKAKDAKKVSNAGTSEGAKKGWEGRWSTNGMPDVSAVAKKYVKDLSYHKSETNQNGVFHTVQVKNGASLWAATKSMRDGLEASGVPRKHMSIPSGGKGYQSFQVSGNVDTSSRGGSGLYAPNEEVQHRFTIQ